MTVRHRVMRVYRYWRKCQMFSPEDSRLMAQQYLDIVSQRYGMGPRGF